MPFTLLSCCWIFLLFSCELQCWTPGIQLPCTLQWRGDLFLNLKDRILTDTTFCRFLEVAAGRYPGYRTSWNKTKFWNDNIRPRRNEKQDATGHEIAKVPQLNELLPCVLMANRHLKYIKHSNQGSYLVPFACPRLLHLDLYPEKNKILLHLRNCQLDPKVARTPIRRFWFVNANSVSSWCHEPTARHALAAIIYFRTINTHPKVCVCAVTLKLP